MDRSDMVGKTITRLCPPTRVQYRGANANFPQPKPLVHIRKPGIEYEIYRVGLDFDPNAHLLLRDNATRPRLRKITTFVKDGTLWERLENDIPFKQTADIKYIDGVAKVYGHALR